MGAQRRDGSIEYHLKPLGAVAPGVGAIVIDSMLADPCSCSFQFTNRIIRQSAFDLGDRGRKRNGGCRWNGGHRDSIEAVVKSLGL